MACLIFFIIDSSENIAKYFETHHIKNWLWDLMSNVVPTFYEIRWIKKYMFEGKKRKKAIQEIMKKIFAIVH